MKKLVFIFITLFFIIQIQAENFDLFKAKKKLDESLFGNLKHNKLKLSYNAYPFDNSKIGIGYEYYFVKKYGFLIEFLDQTTERHSITNQIELNLAASYRFTKRTRDWVFTGNLGVSLNDDITNRDDNNKGFRINHAYGATSVQYTLKNGLGLQYSFELRMPIEIETNIGIENNHIISLIYEF